MTNKKQFVVNCKTTDFDVYIGRGSEYGNPFTHLPLEQTTAKYQVETREEAVAEYEKWLLAQPELVAKVKKELKNKRLGCYCSPLSCHGDILARIANEQ